MAMNLVSIRMEAQQRRDRIEQGVAQGIKSLKEEGYTAERLQKILANELAYKARFGGGISNEAAIIMCQRLLAEPQMQF